MKHKFEIFSSWDVIDDEVRKDTREMLAEANGIAENKVPPTWIDDAIMSGLDDEKSNLNIDTGGYILAFVNLGLWDGKHIGYKQIGTNVNDIFNSFYGGDDCEWFADKYNVRAVASHHDGRNSVVFRLVETKEQMNRLCEKIWAGQIKDEQTLFRTTKSIRPFVARTYGWKQFGRHSN